MIRVRKEHAGATSRGRRWPTDGAVLELPADEAAELLAIPDGGFTAVPADERKAPEREAERAQDAPTDAPAGEAPREPAEADSAPVPPAKRRRRATPKE